MVKCVSKRILPLVIGLLPVLGNAQTLKSFWRNRAGLKHLTQSTVPLAQKDFLRALDDDPLNPSVQMNLGLTFELGEENEKAESAYHGVLSIAPPSSPAHYQAQFNLAGVLGKEKKLAAAAAAYQDCLAVTPESLEVKTNLELLFKGGGKGGGKDDKKDDQKKDPKKDDKEDKRTNQQKREQAGPEPKEKPKPQPRPFDGKDMKPEDVKRILEEIKNQEQAIRANEYQKNPKEAPRGKDW